MENRNYNILVSWLFILGLLLLLLNDHILKYTFPSILTGKLSDFAGLFIFPMFLTFLFPYKKKAVYLITFLGFIYWKLPLTDSFIYSWNSLNIFTINRVIEYTDYVALIVLPFSYLHQPPLQEVPRKKIAVNLIGIISLIAFCSTAGTHGSIKGYEYATSKESLEKAILEVINETPSINRPVSGSEEVYDNSGGYITIFISSPDSYRYTFRFYGGEEHWKNSPNKSEIFICYAYDNEGNGGSEGGGGVEWYKWSLKNNLISRFEENFISKLDAKLGLKHIEKK